MQWRRIERAEIDADKWQQFVADFPEAYYHELSLLDALGVPFVGFVYGEYQACLPVFEKKKFGIATYAFQPILIQRCFVPSRYEQSLINQLRKTYFHFDIAIATENDQEGDQANMFLPAGHNGEIKSKVLAVCNKIEQQGVQVRLVSNVVAFEYLNKHLFSLPNFSDSELQIVQSAFENKEVNLVSYAAMQGDEILGVASIVKTPQRWVYAKGTTPRHSEFSELGVYLLKKILESREENVVFDFGGSMIPGVAAFFRKFKPNQEYYKKYTYFKFPFLKQLR